MVQREILNIIQEFAKLVKHSGVIVDEIYLFGSHALGKATPDSDIDIAVISSGFGKNRYEEGKRLRQLAWRVDPRIEPVPIEKSKFVENDWVPLVYEIKKNGLSIEIAA